MQKINIHEAKTKLSAVLMQVEKTGEAFIICRNGRPVAKLVPHHPHSRLDYHPKLRRIKVNYDPIEDLTAQEWGDIE